MGHQASSRDYKSKTREQSPSRQAASQTFRYVPATVDSAAPYISPYPRTTGSFSDSRETSLVKESACSVSSSSHSSPAHGSSIYSSAGAMSSSNTISVDEKAQLIRSLQTHKVNTLTELRRIEKIFASANAIDTTEPMANAWVYYVDSNNLLNELRGLTKQYPFSSECLDEAKRRVIGDPSSTHSSNHCWLVLTKIRQEGLIPTYARELAVKPVMWSGRTPTAVGVEKLKTACIAEWTPALNQLLRNWS